MPLIALLIHILGLMALIAICVGSVERLPIPSKAMIFARGLPYGIAACLAMMTPAILSDGTVLNGRSLFLAFAGAFGGFGSFITATVVASIGLSQLTNVDLLETVRPTILAGAIGLFWHFLVFPRLGMKLISLLILGLMVSGLALLLLLVPSGHGVTHLARTYPLALLASLAAALILGRFVDRERRHLNRELQWKNEAYTDALTSLSNKRAFFERSITLEHEKATFTILAIDVDHFKTVNDTYGHNAGDIVLRQLAQTIRAVLPRRSEAYRLGGEEFVVILRDVELTASLDLAETIRKAVSAGLIDIGRRAIKVTVSIGVADSSAGFDVSQVLSRADDALYRAKAAGRDRCIPHSDLSKDWVAASTSPSEVGMERTNAIADRGFADRVASKAS